jgi:hypothetical protein
LLWKYLREDFETENDKGKKKWEKETVTSAKPNILFVIHVA